VKQSVFVKTKKKQKKNAVLLNSSKNPKNNPHKCIMVSTKILSSTAGLIE